MFARDWFLNLTWFPWLPSIVWEGWVFFLTAPFRQLRCYGLTYEFSRQLRLFLVVLIKVYYGKGQNKYFWRNLRPEQTCDLNFKRGKVNPRAISFNFLTRFSYAMLFSSIKTTELLLFLAICLNFSESSHNRNLEWKLNVLHMFAKCWIGLQCNRTEK